MKEHPKSHCLFEGLCPTCGPGRCSHFSPADDNADTDEDYVEERRAAFTEDWQRYTEVLVTEEAYPPPVFVSCNEGMKEYFGAFRRF